MQNDLQQALSEERRAKREEKRCPFGTYFNHFRKKIPLLFTLRSSLFSILGTAAFCNSPFFVLKKPLPPPWPAAIPPHECGGQDSGCFLSFLTLQAPAPLPAKGINKIIWNQLTICGVLCIMYVEISDFPSAICQKPFQYSGF